MPNYFEFEVSLCRVEPKVWRRFLLSTKVVFYELHEAIQDACGWWNCHLFVFRKLSGEMADYLTTEENVLAGMPSDEDYEILGRRMPNAMRLKLTSFFGEGKSHACLYEYDIGDSWLHKVDLIREIMLPESFRRRLLSGERAFPHEDCGGMEGYQRHVEFVKTGKHPSGEDPKELLEWLGGWEPERFDLEGTKKYFDVGHHVPIPGETTKAELDELARLLDTEPGGKTRRRRKKPF
jgi:hypothetical protein